MSFIEKIYIKLLGNTKGYDFNMFDWDILTLRDKWDTGKQLTKAEWHAKAFLEQMGEVINRWHPVEKWQKPYGDVLNEHRKLH